MQFKTFTSSNGKAFMIKIIEKSPNWDDLDRMECTYFMLWTATGYWYKIDTYPAYTDDDEGAVSQMELTTKRNRLPGNPPVDAYTESVIRDTYLTKVNRIAPLQYDNFSIIEYRGWSIWSGFNSDAEKGYYFVCDEEGEDIGTVDFTAKDAMDTIDQAIEN